MPPDNNAKWRNESLRRKVEIEKRNASTWSQPRKEVVLDLSRQAPNGSRVSQARVERVGHKEPAQLTLANAGYMHTEHMLPMPLYILWRLGDC